MYYGVNKFMNKKNNWLGTCILTCLIVITGYVIIKECSLNQLMEVLRNANGVWVLLGFFLMIGFVSCEAAIIRSLLRCFGRKVGLVRSMAYAMVGFYFSSVTPSATGGQPMQAFYMKRDDIPLAHSTFTLMVITSFYQLAILVTGLVAYLCSYQWLTGTMHFIGLVLFPEMAVNLLAAAALLLMIFEPAVAERAGLAIIRCLKWLHLLKKGAVWQEKLHNSIAEYREGKEYFKKHPAIMVKTAVLTLLQVSCLYLVPFCACKALGTTVSIPSIMIRQALLSLAVTAVPLPGSVGASEGIFAVLYRHLIPPEMLMPVLVLSRGISFYGFLVVSGISVLVVNGMQNRWKRREYSPKWL